jgi:hypothetical protein
MQGAGEQLEADDGGGAAARVRPRPLQRNRDTLLPGRRERRYRDAKPVPQAQGRQQRALVRVTGCFLIASCVRCSRKLQSAKTLISLARSGGLEPPTF